MPPPGRVFREAFTFLQSSPCVIVCVLRTRSCTCPYNVIHFGITPPFVKNEKKNDARRDWWQRSRKQLERKNSVLPCIRKMSQCTRNSELYWPQHLYCIFFCLYRCSAACKNNVKRRHGPPAPAGTAQEATIKRACRLGKSPTTMRLSSLWTDGRDGTSKGDPLEENQTVGQRI